MEVYNEQMDGTHHIKIYAHDAVYCQYFRSIPLSIEKSF